MRAQALVLGLLLAGCASPNENNAEGEDPCSVSGGTDPKTVYPSQDGCKCPWMAGCGPPALQNETLAQIIVAAQVESGKTIPVAVRNTSNRTLELSTWSNQCPRDAWTAAGRQVFTFCGVDYGSSETLDPGEEYGGFTWSATTCLAGRSNGYSGTCLEEALLPAGRYDLRITVCHDSFADCHIVIGASVMVV